MTLAQLQSFVLVARHGSVKAAAAELEVTEPAVSVAVAALRKELGDELFVRHGRGIALTPGGRRLAALAGEILGLAEQARRSVASARSRGGSSSPPRPLVAEHIGPLIDVFTARDDELEVASPSCRAPTFAEALEHRRADIALGPAPGRRPRRSPPPPFLRCRLIIVAAPSHPLAAARAIAPADARRRALARVAVDPSRARARSSPATASRRASRRSPRGAAAIAAAAAGEGIVLTLAHAVVDEVRRRALVRLDVRGTPIVEMWHASTLGLGRALPAALALQRFATTPEATQAISSGRAGAVARRPARPARHAWQSVGR